jgi:hypothetical protein
VRDSGLSFIDDRDPQAVAGDAGGGQGEEP